jgi:hypothetical protein
MTLSDQMKTALVRAAYGGVLTGAAVFIADYGATNNIKGSSLAAVGALVAYLIARGGVEGFVDTGRAQGVRPVEAPKV